MVSTALKIPSDKGIAGVVATSGEPLIINDPYNDPRFEKDVDKQNGLSYLRNNCPTYTGQFR